MLLVSVKMLPRLCPALVVEVDGTAGQLPLSCLTSSEAVDSGSYKREEIIWTKDGEEEEQRGNTYVVPLLESFGGGNYTCYSSDGSVLNHTVVLIHEDETKRKKILVRHGQGMLLEDSFILQRLKCLLLVLVNHCCSFFFFFLNFRTIFDVFHSKLQRTVPLLLVLAQQSHWQSSVDQSRAVSD